MSKQPARPRRVLADTETGIDLTRRLAPGTLVSGRYRILSIVGVGGMGVVYKAHDQELDQEVALKVLRPDLGSDPQWVERLRRELVLARQVSHRNVVRIHDIGESDGLRFLTMRYVEGRSLQKLLDESGPLPVERAVRIVRQVAEALQDAHAAGVVHRDLKPGNILLEEDDTAYITDFGVARSLDRAGVTVAGTIVGTPDYLAPEQACGEPVDGRADLYALGIVFYEMLTGELPFHGDTQAEMLAQRITGRIRDIGQTAAEAPAWVGGVIRRCLERTPSRRYQNASEIVADLDRRRAQRPRWPPWPVWSAALLLAALAAAGVWRFRASLFPSSAGPEPARPAVSSAARSVAVLPLADETSDPSLGWTAAGVAEMLSARLAQSPDLRVLDSSRVLRTLRALQVPAGRYDDGALRRVAEILEVDRLVAGSIRRAGDVLRLDLRLVTVGPAGTLGTRNMDAEAPGASGLFGMVAGLGTRLRQELGASAPIEEPGTETTSLEAAKAYREGRERLLVADFVSAAPALERAATLDPSFAAAWERLAETYQNLGYQDQALASAERAARATGPTESRLGYRIRARIALLHGNPAEAEKSYAELARRYPNDTEALLDLAAAQGGQGDLERAIETLKRASAIDRNDPRVWFLLGRYTILTGGAAKAASDYLVRALALHSQLRNEQGQADVENALGIAYHEMGDYAQAIEKYSAAADKRQRMGDQRGAAGSRKNRARTYVAMGRLSEAEPDLREARRIYEAIGDQSGLADTWNEFGVLHEARGDFAQALTAYQEALRVRRTLGDERSLAQSYDNVGYIYLLTGQYENALVYAQQALERRRQTGDQGGAVQSMQTIGFVQTALGRWSEAMKTFLAALEKARELDFKNAMAVSHGNIGLLQQYEGRWAAALASLDEALGLLGPLDDKRGLAEFTLRQASVLLDVGRLDATRQKLDAAAALLPQTGNREQQADHQALLGRWHLARGERDEARRAFARAIEEATASRSRAALLRARLAAAEAAIGQGGSPSSARALAAEAEALGDALLRIRATELVGRAELAARRLGDAEMAARRALKLAERTGWEAGRFRLHSLVGRILEKRGDRAGAAAQQAEAERRLSGLQEALPPELRDSFARTQPLK